MKAKENNVKLLLTGIIAAVGASLCCVVPVLAVLAGLGGIATTFSWLDPFRPFLLGLTVLLLGLAWYQKVQSHKRAAACACEEEKEKSSFFQSWKFLSLVTLLAILLLSFPYYAAAFFEEPVKEAALVAEQGNLQQARLDISGMSCAGCESMVNRTLQSKKGVVEAKTDYAKGFALVRFHPATVSLDSLKAAVESELGYQVTISNTLSKEQ